MTNIDAGLFLIVLILALAFMLLSFRIGAVLKIIAMVMFFIAALWMLSGSQVVYSSTTVDASSGNTFTTTKILISNTDNNNNWLGWVFFMLGIVNGFLFFIEVVKV